MLFHSTNMILSNNQKSYLLALKQKKFRQKYQKFIIEGDKMVNELIAEAPDWIQYVVYKDITNIDNVKNSQLYSRFIAAKPVDFEQISSLQHPQNLLALCSIPSNDLITKFNWAFYLDGIQDPGNLGTILRICDWFGWNTIFLSPDTVDVYNPKVIQASMGAIWRLKIKIVNLDKLVQQYDGFTIFAADMNGENINVSKMNDNGIVILGNEGNGIRIDNKPFVHKYITIPKGKDSKAESLNVAISAGIIANQLTFNCL